MKQSKKKDAKLSSRKETQPQSGIEQQTQKQVATKPAETTAKAAAGAKALRRQQNLPPRICSSSFC